MPGEGLVLEGIFQDGFVFQDRLVKSLLHNLTSSPPERPGGGVPGAPANKGPEEERIFPASRACSLAAPISGGVFEDEGDQQVHLVAPYLAVLDEDVHVLDPGAPSGEAALISVTLATAMALVPPLSRTLLYRGAQFSPCGPFNLLRASLVVGEHGVEEIHVGIRCPSSQRLRSFVPPERLLRQLTCGIVTDLRLGSDVIRHALEEALGEPHLALLGLRRALCNRPVRLYEDISEHFGRFVYPLRLLFVHALLLHLLMLRLALTLVTDLRWTRVKSA